MPPDKPTLPRFDSPPTSPDVFAFRGARFTAELHVPLLRAEHITSAGREMPPSISGEFMIDTGAQCTNICTAAARSLGLSSLNRGTRVGISGKEERIDLFYVRIGVGITHKGTLERRWFQPLVGTNDRFREDGMLGIIGRDVLRHMRFTYDGIQGLYTIEVDFSS